MRGRQSASRGALRKGRDPAGQATADKHRAIEYARKGGVSMDFLTAAGIWGIVVLVVINTVLVMRMKVTIAGEEDEGDEKRCAGM